MTDIPEDIMKAAREICAANFRSRGLNGFAISVLDGSLDEGASVPIAVAAILAERQRCADVGTSWSAKAAKNGNWVGENLATIIADDIMKGATP